MWGHDLALGPLSVPFIPLQRVVITETAITTARGFNKAAFGLWAAKIRMAAG